ncbi:hypothetical protein N599_23325 [Saccharopolyspora erythraea D]|nr:hypothetical protein N599_23325 [Saccharopolyspora erythraea D]
MYPSSSGTLRDTDNTRANIRDAVFETEWEGLHPHAFRHLVATVLDRAGLPPREIADYLGHEKISMTQDEYMDRHTAEARWPMPWSTSIRRREAIVGIKWGLILN